MILEVIIVTEWKDPSGSSSWNTLEPIFFKILKSPYLFWYNFFKGLFNWIFLFSNHTFSPTFSSCRFCLFLSNCFFILFCAFSIDLVTCFQLFYNPIRNSFSFGNFDCTMRSPFHGCLPKFNSNDILPVTTCLLLLYWNSIAANYSIQLFCW